MAAKQNRDPDEIARMKYRHVHPLIAAYETLADPKKGKKVYANEVEAALKARDRAIAEQRRAKCPSSSTSRQTTNSAT